MSANINIIVVERAHGLVPHLVGPQLCSLSPVDAHTVAFKPVMGK